MNKKMMLVITLLVLLLGLTSVVSAQTEDGLTVEMSQETAVLVAGDWVELTTTIHNNGSTITSPLVAHLSIAPVDSVRQVDLEDWMPQMTQHLPAIPPGDSTELSWRIQALTDGHYAAFMTALAKDGSQAPVVGAPLQIEVAPGNILPLRDVIPVAVIVPFFPLALLAFSVAKLRRR